MRESDENLLRALPSVNEVLQQSELQALTDEVGRRRVGQWVRSELAEMRSELAGQTRRRTEAGEPQATIGSSDRADLLDRAVERVLKRAEREARRQLTAVINATGVILHTGLGRAPLAQAARTALAELAGAGNVEVDLETGERRYRGFQVTAAWQTLTGAEDVLIVNNNAAATLLTLQTLCRGREVIISRGQLIEIGGSFRLPEIFQLSGAVLREVGTTNRTRLSDYEQAIGPETAAIMHVHPSNYRVVGFVAAPGTGELAELAHRHRLLAIDDIGSGALVDVTAFGLPSEPTFQNSLQQGADLVLASGDKLLGGPQCGIILGRADLVDPIRRHPLARAVRVDKLTLAALSATLNIYLRDAAEREVPTIALLAAPVDALRDRAERIRAEIGEPAPLRIAIGSDTAPVGGGSLPTAELPTVVLHVEHPNRSADELARLLRCGSIPVFPRVQNDRVLIDLRSVLPEDDSRVALALRLLVKHTSSE